MGLWDRPLIELRDDGREIGLACERGDVRYGEDIKPRARWKKSVKT